MPSVKLSMQVRGVKEFVQKVDLSNKHIVRLARKIIKEGTHHIESLAFQNVPKRTHELASTIRAEFSDDGMTGWVRAGYGKLIRRARGKVKMKRVRKRVSIGRRADGTIIKAETDIKVDVRAQARARQSRKARKLSRMIRKGGVGSVPRPFASMDAGVYAPVVEHGDPKRNKPARKFMRRAFETGAPRVRHDFQELPARAAREAGL